MKKKEVNEEPFKHIENGQSYVVEKLVAILIRPSSNNYAELFRDLSLGIASCCFAALILMGILK
jgi:hypothetical protein